MRAEARIGASASADLRPGRGAGRETPDGPGAERGLQSGPDAGSESSSGEAASALPRPGDLPEAGSRIHLMGAAGAGMRALAVLLAEAGFAVSGCDKDESAGVPELTQRGGALLGGHDPGHLEDVDLLIRSTAVPADHPEVQAARDRGVPVWTRPRALGALVNDRTVVGVSGTHGKTTITAMATLAAEAAGLDPAGIVGGRVPAWSGNVRPGAGPAVVEADEYGAAFLQLDPALALVSAVEPEHLESYGGLEDLQDAFRRFCGRARGRLGTLYCADDAGARKVAAGGGEDAFGYGFSPDAEYRVEPVGRTPAGSTEESPTAPSGAERADPGRPARARLETPGGDLTFRLGAPGRHNLQNAAGALAAALRLGADPGRLEGALAGFAGVDRRLQRLADRRGVAVVDDYAHHPTEVRASLEAVRGLYSGRRLVAVFQPHLYSRTDAFAEEFGAALSEADRALVLPIYGAREEPVPGVTSELVVAAGTERVRRATADEVLESVREAEGRGGGGAGGSTFLFMGAGDVTELAHRAARLAGGG